MDHLHSQAFFRTLSPHLQNINVFLTQPYYLSCLLEPFTVKNGENVVTFC